MAGLAAPLSGPSVFLCSPRSFGRYLPAKFARMICRVPLAVPRGTPGLTPWLSEAKRVRLAFFCSRKEGGCWQPSRSATHSHAVYVYKRFSRLAHWTHRRGKNQRYGCQQQCCEAVVDTAARDGPKQKPDASGTGDNHRDCEGGALTPCHASVLNLFKCILCRAEQKPPHAAEEKGGAAPQENVVCHAHGG